MAKKRVRKSTKGAKYRTRTVLNAELKKELVIDSYDHSISWVSKKYCINYRTAKKIIEENPLPTRITAREELDTLKRTELLAKDSMQVMEYTIHSMKTLLEAEIANMKADPQAKSTITVRELKDFFETVAPYVLKKADSNPAKTGEKTPMAMVHNMFAKKPVS